MMYLTMRETHKYQLEEIHRIFEVSTRNLVSYRLFVEFPYKFERYIFQMNVELKPFEESKYNVGMISLGDIDTTSSS